MKILTRNLTVSATLALVVIALAILSVVHQASKAEASSWAMAPALTVATTSTSVAVTTSVRILATTTNPLASPGIGSFTRAYTVICNPNANPVYLNFDADKQANTSNVTAIIAAAAGYNACFQLTDAQMIYNGSIQASSTNQTSTTISVKDYVY